MAARTGMAMSQLVLLLAFMGLGLASSSTQTRPAALTSGGELRGVWVPAERGADSFAAFLGIPYAAPPVGSLRYKAPRPAEKWNGVLDASADPPECPQIPKTGERVPQGQEDCLYLNVYVPEAQQLAGRDRTLIPVLVVVHGGTYQTGSGRMASVGPHFLVSHDILVVTMNYRLGPLGFLGLDTEEIPGNAGLKDMLLALQWVKDNVRAFGGDPERVTLLGWSTGASAVHLLSLLPPAQGLFSRIVLLSGQTISPRAYTERHKARARTLASLLGAQDNSTATISRVLLQASVADILRANDDARMRAVGQPLPSPERRAPGGEVRLVTQDPESLLLRPVTKPLPTILGVVGREGLFPYKSWGLDARSPAALDELLPRLMPADVLPGLDTAALLGAPYRSGPGPLPRDAALRLAQLVRDEYSGGGNIAQDLDVLLQLLGDTFIYESTWRAAGFASNRSSEEAPLRLYRFLVDDKYAYEKPQYNITLPGVAHADDLGYLFRFDSSPNLNQSLLDSGVAPQVLRRNTEQVARYVKGEPLADWPAVRPGLGELPSSWPVLEEGPGLQRAVRHSAPGEHYGFWSSVYRDFRSRNPSIAREREE